MVLFGLALLAACVPEAREGSRLRTGEPLLADAAPREDAASMDALAGDADPTDADPMDAGLPRDAGVPDAEVPDAGPFCGDGVCGGAETCESCPGDCGPCACPLGFSLHDGACAPEAPEPFRSRSEAEICGRWRQDRRSVSPEWEPTPGSSDPCDSGTLRQEAHDNAILRTNLYRWLSGLEPVAEEPSQREATQACAVVMRALGRLDHFPPADTPCYTPAGAQGAGSSNIAYGTSLADSVDLYVADNGVPSLGHRRWVLNPRAQVTAFGLKPTFSCMYSFSDGRPSAVTFVAYPPPGYVPAQLARGVWSFSAPNLAGVRISVAVDQADFEEVELQSLPFGYARWASVVSFNPPGGTQVWRAGRTVRVRVEGLRTGDLEYTVRFVDC